MDSPVAIGSARDKLATHRPVENADDNGGKNTPRIADHFTPNELACKCGNANCERTAAAIAISPTFALTPKTASALADIRHQFGKPLTITSAHRCKHHPIAAAKKRPGSHQQGTAIDIKLPRNAADKIKLISIVTAHAPKGIGIARTFIHFDTGHRNKPRPAYWTY